MTHRALSTRSSCLILATAFFALGHAACSTDDDSGGDGDSPSGGDGDGGGGKVDDGADGDGMFNGAPADAGKYSWDDSWTPSSFPVAGLIDETHADLPPGKWGWDNGCDCPGDEGLAIYENEFLGRDLMFETVTDAEGEVFGWRLVSNDGSPIEMDARLDKFDGTPGVDIIDLKERGNLNGTGPNDQGSPGINLGDGPDMLRFGTGWSIDLRVGDSERGSEADNDLVILGTNDVLPNAEYDIFGATIHTGPGSDLVFTKNFGPAAIDLGNGQSGRTDSVDGDDGDDMAILEGNMRDFRVYGGGGDDVFVWYVDQVVDNEWLGPNFFGGGGWGDAIWADAGVDRLILAIDPATEVVTARGDHDGNPGSFLALIYSDYAPNIDTPTEEDVFARYYSTVPEGPDGQRTVTVSYRSADESVFTHDFYITSVEQVQMGVGDDAIVYDVDYVTGALTVSSAAPLTEIPERGAYEALFDTFPE